MKLSVIIPNYNCSQYVIRCLNSLEEQTFKDFEVVLIDDGSTDDSLIKINEYKSSSNLNLKIIQQNNMNASIARNNGIMNSDGEFIYFLDSDDKLANEYSLENLLNSIDNNDLIIGNYDIIDENDNIIGSYKTKNDRSIYAENVFKYAALAPVPSNKLYKRSIIEKYNLYFANVRIAQDLNFYLKYLSVCENIKIVDMTIYQYRIVNNSISRKISFNIFDVKQSFEDIKNFYKSNNYIEKYDKYISIIEFLHYNQQMNKLMKIDNKKFKKIIFYYFCFNIELIDYNKCVESTFFKKELKKYKIKKLFSSLYLSNFFSTIILKFKG